MQTIIDEALKSDIRASVSNKIGIVQEVSDSSIKDIIEDTVFEKCRSLNVSINEKKELIENIFNTMRRLDILQPIIDDPSVTEIMVNGANSIFVERKGRVKKLELSFKSQDSLENVIQNIVAKVNRVVNESTPIVDARLADGSRVSVVLPPVALNGPILTIRKFPEKPIEIEELLNYGSLTEEVAEALSGLVKAKYNIFVSGGTGSGKTTFLNVLSNFIPKDERVITIEDSAELQIKGIENLVRLETRNANTEGKGEISIKDLIKASLRMRPERIIVGEVRGSEAIDMLTAMNTGHDGSISTGHANSAEDMLSRLETMVLSGANIPLDAIRKQISSAIDIIVHLGRIRDKSRKVLEISEVKGFLDGRILLNPLYIFKDDGEDDTGNVMGKLVRTENSLNRIDKFKMSGINMYF